MRTVPGRSPGSFRPLARTMGCSTWHSPQHEYLLCFLEWGALFVSPGATAGAASLLEHLQGQGLHSGSQARASAPFRSGCRCFLREEGAPSWRTRSSLLSTQQQVWGWLTHILSRSGSSLNQNCSPRARLWAFPHLSLLSQAGGWGGRGCGGGAAGAHERTAGQGACTAP